MRVIFTTQGALGHFHPLVPIARAAVQAGHEVAFATQPPFAPTVERSGFLAFPAGLAKPVAEAFPEVLALRGSDELVFLMSRIRPALAAAMAADLLGIMTDWQPGLVVRERTEFGGSIVAERLGIPYAAVEIIAAGSPPHLLPIFSEGLAPVLAEHGLPPDPDLQISERQAVISPFPPSYRGVPVRLAPTPWLSIRPTPFDQSGEERMPAWLDELPAQPTIFLTLGTSPQFNTRTAVFRSFIEGLAGEPVNLLVALGRNNDPVDYGPLPSNVRIERYIPQTLVFSRCDVVVCHGGSGSVMAAMTHGLPLVLVPIGADQPRNASRCADLGVAHVLDEGTLDPAVARAAVRDVLDNPRYRQRAKELRVEIEGLPGPEQAVSFLEQLAAGHELTLSHR
jgi:UDP:flavonoid glycosyltransferase YjiC (YdhE family)